MDPDSLRAPPSRRGPQLDISGQITIPLLVQGCLQTTKVLADMTPGRYSGVKLDVPSQLLVWQGRRLRGACRVVGDQLTMDLARKRSLLVEQASSQAGDVL
jgi:hypothetical protein